MNYKANPIQADGAEIEEVIHKVQNAKRALLVRLIGMTTGTTVTQDIYYRPGIKRGDMLVTYGDGSQEIMARTVFDSRFSPTTTGS